MSAPRILFVGHEATRTGAPLILLHFLRWLSRERGWPIEILLVRGGELRSAFAALGPTACLDEGVWGTLSPLRSVLRRSGFDALGRRFQGAAVGRALRGGYDLIYCNSVAAAPALAVLRSNGTPVLCHVHELGFSFGVTVPADDLARLVGATTRYVACAEAVADYLRHGRDVADSMIDVVHEFLLPDAGGPSAGGAAPASPRQRVVVGAVGTVGWRKGTDLFLQLALRMRRRFSSGGVRFVWVGGGDREDLARARHDLESAGLEDVVTFLGPAEDPTPHYAAIDVFVLPSREDPFPLVCIEAAAAGKPIVCFDRAGGAPELVEADCGFVVPYLDLDAMAERVQVLIEDPDLRRRLGENAKRKVHARYTLALAAPKLLQSIETALARSGAPSAVGSASMKGSTDERARACEPHQDRR